MLSIKPLKRYMIGLLLAEKALSHQSNLINSYPGFNIVLLEIPRSG